MRKMRLLFLLLFFLSAPMEICAQDMESAKEEYLEAWREKLDFSELDTLLLEDVLIAQEEPVRFSDVVDGLLEEGFTEFDYSTAAAWVKDSLLYELGVNRKVLLEAVMLAVVFSLLKNFSSAFKQAYISEVSFFLVYGIFAILLLQSFSVYTAIVENTLGKSLDFMKAFVPTFCISMVFAAGGGTSAGFYQIAFLVIYLIQWIFLRLLMPMIHGYVLLELFHHFFAEDKFENLTELIKGGINWGLKSAGILVVGLNVVQGLIAPAHDRLTSQTIQKAAAMIPGIGNVVNGIGELLLGSGILIKNCVGTAALVVLFAIGLLPVLKLLCISAAYKLAAAAVEPVSDKRMAGCLKGMAEGGLLYVKLLVYCLALFMVTIALATAASGLTA